MASFIREIQLKLGPLKEIDSSNDSPQSLIIKSAGRDDEFNIKFQIVKTLATTVTTMEVYNLSEPTRQTISQPALNVIVQAGYQQGDLPLQTIAQGAITSVVDTREEGDIKSTIRLFDGLSGLAIGKFTRSYRGQQQVSTIVKDVATNLPGIKVDANNIKVDAVTGTKGRTLAGKASDVLDSLARSYGFSWGIKDKVFIALDDQKTSGKEFDISATSGSMLRASPLLQNVLQLQTGVEIETLLNPQINPFDKIQLNSLVNPSLNHSTYKVTSIAHSAGIRSTSSWNTTIQCAFILL